MSNPQINVTPAHIWSNTSPNKTTKVFLFICWTALVSATTATVTHMNKRPISCSVGIDEASAVVLYPDVQVEDKLYQR